MKLVVTIPAQNEEKTIARVVEGVPRDLPGVEAVEILVLDDDSEDQTAQRAEAAGARVIRVHGRPGLGKVFRAGIEAAMRSGADLVVNIDGDGQFDPADIVQIAEPLLDGRADFVTCSRFRNPDYHPTMPAVKFWGNWAVVRIVNSVCGGSRFTDVSCGFRGFNREALYRMTLFGRYTYTQETFIDLFSKGLRIEEVPLRVRGVREHGKSRVAGSVWKYAANTGPIILRAMRDIRPLKFFGGIALLLGLAGMALFAVVAVNYFYINPGRTQPFTSFIDIGTGVMILSMVTAVLALLADMMARHRRITEELLYLARRRIYGEERAAHDPSYDPSVDPVGEATVATALNGGSGLRRPRTGKAHVESPIHRTAPDPSLEAPLEAALAHSTHATERRRADNREPVAAHAD